MSCHSAAVALTRLLNTVHFCSFGGFHKFPTLINGIGCRQLCKCMLAVFHSIDTLNGMKMPGCCNRHKMNIPSLTNFFPFIFPSRIAIRLMVGTADSLFRTFNPVGFQIAKGLDLHTFDTCECPAAAHTPVTQANDCHVHWFKRRGCVAVHITPVAIVAVYKRFVVLVGSRSSCSD